MNNTDEKGAAAMRVSEALEEFYLSMDGVVSQNTLKWYHHKLDSLDCQIGDFELEKVSIHDLRKWRSNLANKKEKYVDHPTKPTQKGKLANDTMHGYVRGCRTFFKWLYEEHLIEINPALRLELPQKSKNYRRGIKVHDRDLIIEEAHGNFRDYAMVLFLADSACRVGGVAGLKIQDLDLENSCAIVYEKGRGGNQKARLVFFGEKTKRALIDWLDIRPLTPECQNVFGGLKKGGKKTGWHALTESGVYQAVKRLACKAGIETGFNPHNWRHGAARGLIKNGASLPVVSQILGHSSVQVTGDIYGMLSEDELREVHSKHGWLE
ncbi:MAG: tyrosine-type recombinase/integrase [Anaerolineaceae bacterium]